MGKMQRSNINTLPFQISNKNLESETQADRDYRGARKVSVQGQLLVDGSQNKVFVQYDPKTDPVYREPSCIVAR